MASVVEPQPNTDSRPLVAHAVYRLGVGGMENGLVNLVNRLPRDRFRHVIICLTESSEFEQRINVDNVAVYELHKREGKDPSFYLRFWRLLRKLRPAMLHTRNLGTLDLAPVAMLARVPVRVHGEHGWDASDPFGQSFKYRLLRRVCDFAVSEYVAVSQDIANWLGEIIGVREGRVRQIYNGVDVNKFCPEGDKANLPFVVPADDEVIIGAVGRMDPIKNFDRLIAAVARMIESEPTLGSRLRLVIVGDGPLLSEYRQLVTKLGLQAIVWLPGTRDDIAALLRSMHLFILPSRNEGISNTILESMSTGLPVIASNIGGNPELVSDGESGFLISVNDTDAIIEAIERYLQDRSLMVSHGRAARERVINLFGLQAMVESYGQLYDRLLSTSRSTGIH